MSRQQSILFVPALASISLIGPLAVHLYFPAIPAAKAALSLSDAQAQFAFSVSLFCMSFATLGYGALSDRYGRRCCRGCASFSSGARSPWQPTRSPSWSRDARCKPSGPDAG